MANIKTSELLPPIPEGSARFWWRDGKVNFEDVHLPKSGAYELFTYDQMREYAVAAIESSRPPAPVPEQQCHPDDLAVDRFAKRMKWKLGQARQRGRSGWEDRAWTPEQISQALREHVEKGDPVDVANYCMFLAERSEAIYPRAREPWVGLSYEEVKELIEFEDYENDPQGFIEFVEAKLREKNNGEPDLVRSSGPHI